ncbi:GSCFA domain-containing protein [uncultured Amphritea sp.]|uniref:GSCFA domain-containing protein n=1 Tax=uncultured Amphritea sp. TaxID=981605 RepID=UPI0026196837|nr:GSCFA domain-containing protein [uncultured Amphritea sp.]
MAIEIISSEEAWAKENLKNKTRRWPLRHNPERLYPIATPVAEPSFKIGADEKIFCIGSCFANEISQALHRLDYNVLSIFHELSETDDSLITDDSVFHKYNVASIYNELAWSLDPEIKYDHDKVMVNLSEDCVQDYQLSGKDRSYSRESAELFRNAFNASFSKIKEADVVVLTLGVSEVWYDKASQLYLNVAVPKSLTELYPDRFELHVFDYETTSFYVKAIYKLLESYLKSDFRLLITVSPIPLIYTFRKQDVFVSNSYSKAVLRVVVEELVKEKVNVNYFPSYEFVTLSNPTPVWSEKDFRHVDASFVDYIIGHVMAQFTDSTAAVHRKNKVLKVKSLYYGGFVKEAKELLSSIRNKHGALSKEELFLWGVMHAGLSGKLKTLFYMLAAYFKTYKHLSLYQHISSARYLFRMKSEKSYVGYVDRWDGHCLNGWGFNKNKNKSVKISVMHGKTVIKTEVANFSRPDVAEHFKLKHSNTGFKIPLDKALIEGKLIRIVFEGTDIDLAGSPIYIEATNPHFRP